MSEEVSNRHSFVAMWARTAGSQPPAKASAVFASLLAEVTVVALRALVHDRRLWQTCGQAEWELVRRTLAKAEAALSTRVVTIRLTALRRKTATASTARPLVRCLPAIVTQRVVPPVEAVVDGASSRPSVPAGERHGPGDPGWRPPGWDHRRPAPDARPRPAAG